MQDDAFVRRRGARSSFSSSVLERWGARSSFQGDADEGHATRPSFRLVGVLLLAYLVAGTTAFYLSMDHMSGDRTGSRVLDASVVTMTTVGYGDIVPASDAAKLLACAFAFAGVALVGTFLSKAADYLVEKQEALLYHALHIRDADRAKTLRAMEMNKTRRRDGPVDAFYCACSTVTTLGYGDRSFVSPNGRAFASAWVTVSTLVVALFFLYAAELGVERRQRALARWVLTRRTTSTDLEAADVDGDSRVGAADFVLYKLKELGKISQEEIAEFLQEFDDLDADNSGFSCRTTSTWRSTVSSRTDTEDCEVWSSREKQSRAE
ncbi:hypothetical protein QOZ80_9BG0707060 [Eleusine coracana subsp. coracana]|nr:hypothetical protein QOZ80_9BG0707060 [Eleusine coracana subsp. coracana]